MPSRVGSISSLFSNGGGGGGGAGRKSRRQSQVANVGVKANANGGVEEMEGDDDVGNGSFPASPSSLPRFTKSDLTTFQLLYSPIAARIRAWDQWQGQQLILRS